MKRRLLVILAFGIVGTTLATIRHSGQGSDRDQDSSPAENDQAVVVPVDDIAPFSDRVESTAAQSNGRSSDLVESAVVPARAVDAPASGTVQRIGDQEIVLLEDEPESVDDRGASPTTVSAPVAVAKTPESDAKSDFDSIEIHLKDARRRAELARRPNQ